MIPLEGRVIAGLDEFMLRVGHLKVLASVAIEVGGNWSRIERHFARFLTEPLVVPPPQLPYVTEYVSRKRLCPSATEATLEDERAKYRYPELMLESDDHGGQRLRAEQGEIRVWRQDLWMASPEVRSKVGAVTVQAKSGSKTGVSHIRDWSILLDLFSAAGQLAPEGHLAVKLNGDAVGEQWQTNPYVIGHERLIFAHLLFTADMDVLARFAPKLFTAPAPLRRGDATAVFSEALTALNNEAETTRTLSSTKQFRLLQQLREIQGQQRAGSIKASTTWHRAASRLETYVDIGLLEKGRGGDSERYEYTYYPTSTLARCVKSLERASSAEQWIEEFMVSTVFNVDTSSTLLAPSDVEPLLRRLGPCLGRPISLLPITALALGICSLTAKESKAISFRAARDSVEEFARVRPDLARLSRGGSGSRAEFVSLLMKPERG